MELSVIILIMHQSYIEMEALLIWETHKRPRLTKLLKFWLVDGIDLKAQLLLLQPIIEVSPVPLAFHARRLKTAKALFLTSEVYQPSPSATQSLVNANSADS
jgi:hypothetical protein